MQRLALQPWMIAAQRVMDALDAAQPGCARFVGGCVRNALLGEPVSDIDIATQLTPDRVKEVTRAAGMAVHPTGVEHGTVTVVANHKPFEVTTLRRDVETDGRRAVVAFTQDWAEDAQRRDFRMNALYADRDGQIYDPTGGGLDDVAARRIVFVGDPDIRIREDYLRILRFFRFQAWYGREAPDAAGLEACSRLRSGLAGISAERIWMETKKLLSAPHPLASLAAMEASGVLAQVFPAATGLGRVERLVALEQREGFAPDPMQRFLALFRQDATALREAASQLKMSNEERHRLAAASGEGVVSSDMPASAVRAEIYRSGVQAMRDRVILAWADSGEESWRGILAEIDAWTPRPMPLTGADLLSAGFQPGPAVGQAMRKAEEAWISSDFSLDRAELLKLVS